tara:strand:- start:1019 stop:1279 length:261 start_codon:yes stop_codon:yes gene_type:complete
MKNATWDGFGNNEYPPAEDVKSARGKNSFQKIKDLRDSMATAALQGMLARADDYSEGFGSQRVADKLASQSYMYADAMLEARDHRE